MPMSPEDECVDGLQYLSVLTFACGHHVELHTAVQPVAEDMVGVDKVPCPWCIAKEHRPEVADLHHFHFPYRRGDAAFRRSPVSPEEFASFLSWQKEMEEPSAGTE